MQNGGIMLFGVGEDTSQCLTGIDSVARLDVHLAQITINRKVISMAYDDGMVEAGDGKDTRHHTFEDGTGIGSGSGLDINAIVVGTDIF